MSLSSSIFHWPNSSTWTSFNIKMLKALYLLLHGTYKNATYYFLSKIPKDLPNVFTSNSFREITNVFEWFEKCS